MSKKHKNQKQNSGFSLPKQNKTDKVKQEICNNICYDFAFAGDDTNDINKLRDRCKNCVVQRITKIETKK